jgi:hypothetical protein
MMRFAVLVLMMFAVAPEAHACSCMESGPPCQSFFRTEAVFVGTVRSITPTTRVPPLLENVRVEFEETVGFRGVEGSTQVVFTSSDGPACGYPFKVGQRYVVYGSRYKGAEPLVTGTCSRTRPVAEAAEDLQFFQSLSSATGSPRVFGSVTQREPGTIYRDGTEYGPVGYVWLTLKNDTATYRALTDSKGRYELTGVPLATYDLTIEPPDGLTPGDRLTHTLTLGDRRSCAERNFTLRFDSRIRGSLRRSTGEPAAGVRVQLIRKEYLDRNGPVDTIDTTSDAAGAFEFREVSTGSYVLGVDIFRSYGMSPDSEVVFAPTYHPGTSDLSRATIVDIRGGEAQELTPITLSPPLRVHRLTGTVKYADGTPAIGATVTLDDPIRKWLDLAEPIETDGSGTFSFVVHEGLSYIVSAYYYRGPMTRGVRPVVTSVGPFTIADAPAPLDLVITRTQ